MDLDLLGLFWKGLKVDLDLLGLFWKGRSVNFGKADL